MTTLFLARHGQTDWNLEGRYQGQVDIPLNGFGREQAKILAGALQQVRPDAVWASDLCRAKETAVIIAVTHNLPVQVHSGLREMNFGSWQGLTWQEVEKQFPDAWQRWADNPESYHIPDGETLKELDDRFQLALTGICAKYPSGSIVIVAHGGPISRLLSGLTGRKFWEMMHGNCSYSILHYRQEGFEYRGTNNLRQEATD
jgi:broad specificity phosphatase PhoE